MNPFIQDDKLKDAVPTSALLVAVVWLAKSAPLRGAGFPATAVRWRSWKSYCLFTHVTYIFSDHSLFFVGPPNAWQVT